MTYFYAACCVIALGLLVAIYVKVKRPILENNGIITADADAIVSAVNAYARKNRELLLEAIANSRQHGSTAWDSVVSDTKEIKRDTNWLRAAWSKFSGK